ncbi:hypothetical protein HL653_22955 [Sphingomonas sp. AP4-R1]|uniref:calcium-binding protein n=1 Tax=Sphingomonas sp. AP4-R1 TaxID=2735134 RepID=UPI0014935D65|nr:calcium-binding protein [Sphingomonas sp. AP4-R1]QJU60217.1 hypothetical protein HL653_22955 [Sphingomonas sp. AP4-R1]
MAFSDIESQIIFYGYNGTFDGADPNSSAFTEEQRLTIVAQLRSLYDNSADGRAMLETATANGMILKIAASAATGIAWSGVADPYLGIDFQAFSTQQFMTADGRWVNADERVILGHELGHLIRGTQDPVNDGNGFASDATMNVANYNYAGSAVDLENVIADQLGVANHRISYNAQREAGGLEASFDPSISYTDGHTVEIARFGQNSVDNDIDISARTESMLAFGFGGIDTIRGGAGNDYIYGGDGDGYLYGGKGDDHLYGGINDDVIEGGDGNDYIDGGAGGADQLFGGVGNDHITATAAAGVVVEGGSGDDVIEINAGTDDYASVTGGAGNDRIVVKGYTAVDFSAGDGHDTIDWQGWLQLKMNGISLSDVTVHWDAQVIEQEISGSVEYVSRDTLMGDLAIVLKSTGDSIVIKDVTGGRAYFGDSYTDAEFYSAGVNLPI